MKENTTLPAQERTATGKGAARKLRASGLCPAVLYGPSVKSRALHVDPKALLKLLTVSGENALLDLQVSSVDGQPTDPVKVIVRDFQFHPMGDLPSHIDFYQVPLDRAISLTVPLSLNGTPRPLELKTGTLSQMLHQLNIECLPGNIPSVIEADVSELDLGQSVHVSDLTVPAGVTVTNDPTLPVASVSALKEVPVEEEEAAVEGEAAEPEVIGAAADQEEDSSK